MNRVMFGCSLAGGNVRLRHCPSRKRTLEAATHRFTNDPMRGYAWNGVYGVVDEYGFYPSPVAIPSSSPWHLLDIVKTDSLVAMFRAYSPYPYLWEGELGGWIHPWIQNKLILGLMARWKAIYLFKGYDKVWSILQSLGSLPGQSPPATLTLQDGTMANGNWSARELCSVLNLEGYMGSLATAWGAQPNVFYGYSLFALVQCLDQIANGNWVGPQGHILGTPIQGLSRPVSFRDRLAAAAV
jgi:hypothetical protein